MTNKIKFNGTRDELCQAIAKKLREAYDSGHANASVGLRRDGGGIDWDNLPAERLEHVFVEQVGDLDANVGQLDPEEGFTDETESGLTDCWRNEWLRDWEIQNEVSIETLA